MPGMQLTVIVECQPSGPVPGYQVQHVSEDEPISNILHTYCEYKGVSLQPGIGLISRNRVWLDSDATVGQCNIRDGDRLFLISTESQHGGSMFRVRWNRWWTLTVLSLGVAILGLLVCSLVFALSGSAPFGHGVVFDAGSTHTEMLLYQWKGEKWRDTGIVEERHTCDMPGGIGELFKSNPEGVQLYLDKCLQEAVSGIPERERPSSPIYLAATAGLRMLQLEEPLLVDQILGNASTKLKSSGLHFAQDNAKVITGTQEAVAGWVTVNFLSNKLLPGDKPHELGTMLGALDMGGASTQITFELGVDPNIATEELKLYGQDYHLYAKSYMCHGVAQAMLRQQIALYKKFNGTKGQAQKNPCLATGNMLSYSSKAKINSCTNTSYANKYEQFSFEGTSNGTECLEQIRKVISPDFCNSTFIHPNCIVNPPPARPPNSTFVGFSNYYYVASGFNITNKDNITEFLNRVLAVCALSDSELKNIIFPEVSDKFKNNMCFMGLYMYVILNDVYKFTPSEWERTFYAKTINNTSVGWTLGFMTESTNAIPAESVRPGIAVPWFVILTLIFIGLVGLSVWLGRNAVKVSRFGRLSRTHPTSYGTLP